MFNDHEPDPSEKSIRFGCGFVFGGVVAFLFALREMAEIAGPFWAFVLGVAVVFGVSAVRYGDAFWHAAVDWFRGW